MTEQLFTYQQLANLKRSTLEERIDHYYNETHDEKNTIKYLIALQVRDELGEDDFSFVLPELVSKLFLKTKSTRTLRRYYHYFRDYFSSKEWQLVKVRLFPVKTYIPEAITEKVKQVREQVASFLSEAFTFP